MSRKRTPNVLTLPLSKRSARGVAAALKRWGYGKATFEDCYKKSSIAIGLFFEPMDPDARAQLIRRISVAAGLQPKNPERKNENGQS